jgi:RNA polymerase sigma-70 factor (ECF subfamily)
MEDDVRRLLQARRYRDALERLLEMYETRIFRMAVMMLRDRGRAEEVTQDVFVKVWQALPLYDGRAAPSTWLYTIARNTCLSAVRSESYRRTSPLDDSPEPAAPAHSPADRFFEDAAIERCLLRLPQVQREVITLFYLEEKNVKEVARLLDIPEGTVKSHLHRARVALGEMMG